MASRIELEVAPGRSGSSACAMSVEVCLTLRLDVPELAASPLDENFNWLNIAAAYPSRQ
jgi:hypothetical protein